MVFVKRTALKFIGVSETKVKELGGIFMLLNISKSAVNMDDTKISNVLFVLVISMMVWQGTVLAANKTVTNLTYPHEATMAVPYKTPLDSKREQVSTSAYNRRVEEYTVTTTPLLPDQDESTGGKAFPWNATTALITLHDGIAQYGDETTSSPLDTKEPTILSSPWNGTSLNITSSKTLCATGPYGSDFIQIFCYCDGFCNIFEDCCEPYHPCDRSSTNDEHAAFSYEIDIRRNDVDCIMHSLDSRSLPGSSSNFCWMVISCPTTLVNETIRDRCENRSAADDIERHLPVSDPATKLTFRNRYCAMCHNFDKYDNWSPIVTCNTLVTSRTLNINRMMHTADVLKVVRENSYCKLYFEPPATIPGRRCFPHGDAHGNTRLNENTCDINADPTYRELCSSGPQLFTNLISAKRQEYYMRNAFCWKCLYSRDETLRVEPCPSNTGAVRFFDPSGLGMLINPSSNRESCSRKTSQDICGDESDQCSTPILSIINMDFPLKLALSADGPLNISNFRGVCRYLESLVYELFTISPTPTLSAILSTKWMFLNPLFSHCAEISDNDSDEEWHNSSVLAVLTSHVRLREEIKSYGEGLKMFESFRDELDIELRMNTMFRPISFGNVDYQVTVPRDVINPCANLEKPLESNVETTTKDTHENAMVSGGNQYLIQWAFAVCAFGVFVGMRAFAPSG